MKIEVMRRLYASDRCPHGLLNNAVRPNTALTGRESTVEDLQNVLTLEGVSGVSRRELVASLRRLHNAGAGKFLLGRRGRPSRFVWTQLPREVAKILQPPAPVASPTTASPQDIREEGGMCTHTFRLRRQLSVFLKLPADLSPHEAARLATFVQSLPLEEAGSPTAKADAAKS